MSLSAAEATELFRSPPSGMIEAGDGAIAHRVVGSGPPVLFVHGWPVTGATYRRLLPHLADHVTCHVIDLLGTGSSRFDAGTELSVARHIATVRQVIEQLGESSLAVVGHDSGGMIARHAIAGDARIRGVGLIDTEQTHGLHWRFRAFLSSSRAPGFAQALRWAVARPRVRRNQFVLGKAFADPSLLEGEFDEFFLRPLVESPEHLAAAMRIVRSFERRHLRELAGLHRRITAPVRLVWGEEDAFFPVAWAEEMVATFPSADLHVVGGAGLFSHEERPAEVAEALLPVLVGR